MWMGLSFWPEHGLVIRISYDGIQVEKHYYLTFWSEYGLDDFCHL